MSGSGAIPTGCVRVLGDYFLESAQLHVCVCQDKSNVFSMKPFPAGRMIE